ncbi:YceK/YidQ family lipoprotein [Erwiniaceae bacterium CAU 1747]
MLRMLMLIFFLTALTGCASMESRSPNNYQRNSFYSGTQQDYHCFFDSALCALDLPLSAVGDTLMTPFYGWYYYQTPDDDERENNKVTD